MGKSSDKHSYSSSSDSENTKDIDDSIGHYQIEFGQTISDRYHLKDQCGIGTFGKVYLALDSKKNEYVAIKVVRKIKRYVESAKIEADVLCDIRNKQFKENKSSCVEMFSDFDFNGFYCLVFEPLGISIYEFIKLNNYKGFSLDIVKDFSYQLLDAIAFLHSHKLIHTDLKLENILLIDNSVDIYDKSSGRRISSTPNDSNKRPRLSENDRVNSHDPLPPLSTISPPDRNSYLVPRNRKIKIIDFGGATYNDEKKSSIVNTRQYRGPEVILEIGWSYPSDVWSCGCIIAEMASGELLFPTHENTEHLSLIQKLIGHLPYHMIDASPHKKKYFYDDGEVSREKLSRDSKELIHNFPKLSEFVRSLIGNNSWDNHSIDRKIYQLLRELLLIDPSSRITAREALKLSYFK